MMNPAWNWQPIGELFRFGAGKTMSAAARTGTHKTPFLRTSNVLWDQIDLSNVDQMAMSPGELEEKSLRPGDLLVCEGGNIGRAAMWNGQLPLMSFQNHLHRLRHIHGNVHVRFYVYFLQSAFTQLGLFDGAGNKTTIPNLSRNQLAALRVPVSPLNEQRAISDSLRTIRTAIAFRAKAILLAEELKQATMARLFTCGLRDEPQQQTAIGMVPASWHVCTLADVCKNQGSVVQTGPFGSQLHASDYMAEGVPVINPTHMANSRVLHGSLPRVSNTLAENLPRHRLRLGDILFSRRGDIGRLALIDGESVGSLCGTGCCLVRVDSDRVLSRFLAYLFSTLPLVSWLQDHSAGIIMPNVNTAVLSRLPVMFPSLDDQQTIVNTLDTLDRSIGLHERKRAILEDLFQSLLFGLMTGKTRVDQLDLSVLPNVGTTP